MEVQPLLVHTTDLIKRAQFRLVHSFGGNFRDRGVWISSPNLASTVLLSFLGFDESRYLNPSGYRSAALVFSVHLSSNFYLTPILV